MPRLKCHTFGACTNGDTALQQSARHDDTANPIWRQRQQVTLAIVLSVCILSRYTLGNTSTRRLRVEEMQRRHTRVNRPKNRSPLSSPLYSSSTFRRWRQAAYQIPTMIQEHKRRAAKLRQRTESRYVWRESCPHTSSADLALLCSLRQYDEYRRRSIFPLIDRRKGQTSVEQSSGMVSVERSLLTGAGTRESVFLPATSYRLVDCL